MNASQDRFRGTLLGLALGDAIGYPCEFRSREQILSAFGPGGVDGPVGIKDSRWPARPWILGPSHPPGTYTDDTQMSIALARGLVEAGHGTVDDIMLAIADHFVRWSRSDDNDRAPGSTCMTGCERLARGVPWRDAGVADSKGCGSAMRVAPIGLVCCGDTERLLDLARSSSLLTHGHPAAIEGAAAAALAIACALDGQGIRDICQSIMRQVAGRSDDFDRCMERLHTHIDSPPEIALSARGIGEAWVAEEAIASALYCLWQNEGDFRATVLMAANTDGDSDSIACIAGGIAGAMGGTGCLPAEWLDVLEDRQELTELADALWHGRLDSQLV